MSQNSATETHKAQNASTRYKMSRGVNIKIVTNQQTSYETTNRTIILLFPNLCTKLFLKHANQFLHFPFDFLRRQRFVCRAKSQVDSQRLFSESHAFAAIDVEELEMGEQGRSRFQC